MSKIFLSHAAADRDLAAFIDGKLLTHVSGADVFRTTRVGQVPAGKAWFDHIGQALGDADRFLVLLTPASASRPWVLFEAGAAWMSKRPLVLALAGGLAASSVDEPLRNFQLLSLEDLEQASQVFRELGGDLVDPTAFCAQVRSLADVGRTEALRREGWKQHVFAERTFAWDGPLERLAEGPPIPVPAGLVDDLKSTGLICQYALPNRLWREQAGGLMQIWELDNLMRKRQLLNHDAQVLMVKEKGA